MLVTLSGRSMLVKLLHPENAEEPMLAKAEFSSKITDVRFSQPVNAPAIPVTVLGMVISVTFGETKTILVFCMLYKTPFSSANAVFPSAKLTRRFGQLANAPEPMLVTPLGISILVKLLHPENA